MSITGISIHRRHRSFATRSVKFDFVCRSCGCCEPAIVQAGHEGTSTNKFTLRDLFRNHVLEAEEVAHTQALALAKERMPYVRCPDCDHVDVGAVREKRRKIRRSAIVHGLVGGLLLGQLLAAVVGFCIELVGVSFPQYAGLFETLSANQGFVITVLTGMVIGRISLARMTRAFDELLTSQRHVVLRCRDPEAFYAIVESGAWTAAR